MQGLPSSLPETGVTMRRNLLFSVALISILTACTADRAAPVHNIGLRADSAAGAGTVMVRDGDTVWRISERYRLPLRDIIDLNGMAPPYRLQTGQRLLLPPPNEHKVGTGDTLTRVSRMYGVSASQIVQMNNLAQPYHLAAGQVLRLPSAAARQQRVNLAAAQNRMTPPQPKPATSSAIVPARPEKKTVTATQTTAAKKQPAKPATTLAAPAKAGFVWPVRGRVVSGYGAKPGHLYNDGINIAAPRGTPVAAAADGVVAYVGSDLSSYGNLVLVRHAGGYVTAYAHLDTVSVQKGDNVTRGRAIGTVGSTGSVENSQLHFEIRRGMDSINPATYLG